MARAGTHLLSAFAPPVRGRLALVSFSSSSDDDDDDSKLVSEPDGELSPDSVFKVFFPGPLSGSPVEIFLVLFSLKSSNDFGTQKVVLRARDLCSINLTGQNTVP
jgi:hypothetical protein